MKATHVVIANEGKYLKAGEKVYIYRHEPGDATCTVQSILPSFGDGRWCTWAHNLKKIFTQMENK